MAILKKHQIDHLEIYLELGMSRHERRGERDLTYSKWHRSLTDDCTAIDVDMVEYSRCCNTPLALVETCRLVHECQLSRKKTNVLRQLGIAAKLPVYLVFYVVNETTGLIEQFLVRRERPRRGRLHEMTPDRWARFITRLHARCKCKEKKSEENTDQHTP